MYLSVDQRPPALSPAHADPRVETLLEQGSGRLNEDRLCLGNGVYGVFDGATSLDGRCYEGGRTGGYLAASIAAETFGMGGEHLPTLAAHANQRIRLSQLQRGVDLADRQGLWSTSAAVVELEDGLFHYCLTGDAMVLVLYHDGTFCPLHDDPAMDRQTLELWQKADVSQDDSIHVLLAEQIRRVRLEMNRSYGVLNGEPEAMDFLTLGSKRLDGVSDIVLFTDGLFLPSANIGAERDWAPFVRLYRRGGLAAVHQQVRQLQAADPDCRCYPRFKTHDDIAAIGLSFLA